MTPTPASLRAVADWNAERGCALYRQAAFEKNHFRQERMLKDFSRHVLNADSCRRAAWVLEHQSQPRRRRMSEAA